MRKYTDVYKGEEPPKRKDVLWAHHSIKDDLTSPVVVQIFSKGKWVDAYEGGGAEVERLSEELGDITDLKTTDKDSTVDAINEVVDNVGDLSDLTTTAKTDLVSAINEASTKGDPASLLYTAQSLTEAQKTQALANIGAASQQEFESLSAGEVVPVTELPNASDDTMGKIYLVGPDANDEYDRYISSYNGTNYSWVQVGTTQMDLSGYATDAEVSQLEAKLYNSTPTETDITSGSSNFNGLARISTEKYESSTSATIWIKYIPVEAGKQYKIKTLINGETSDVPINTAWMSVMFSEQAPANNGVATSIKNYTSTPATIDETYTPATNGYVGVGINGSSAYLGRIKFFEIGVTKTLKTDDIEDEIGALDGRVEDVEGDVEQLTDDVSALDERIDELEEEQGEELNEEVLTEITAVTKVEGMIMRNTSHQFEATTSGKDIYYFPVVAGKTYRIIAKAQTISATSWSYIGFSTATPANNGAYESVYDPETTASSDYDVYYTPEENGYICVYSAYSASEPFYPRHRIFIAESENRIEIEKERATTKEYALEDSIGKVDDKLYDIDINATEEIITDRTNVQLAGVEADGSMKIVLSYSDYSRLVYIPVKAGNTYHIYSTGEIFQNADRLILGFSRERPADNVGVVAILTTGETPETFDLDTDYTPQHDGFLSVGYYGNDVALGRIVFANKTIRVPKDDYLSKDAAIILADPPQTFNIGLTTLQSKVKTPTPLVISGSGSNYNTCIGEYMNRQDGRRTSRLIPSAKYNLYPGIGDPTKLYGTYFRMLIGVDSEGYAYVAQRKCANNSQGTDVNIYKTKDFETFTVFKSNSAGAQVIEMDNGELCLATYEAETVDGTSYIRCFIYITENNKTTFVKKFACSQISQYVPAAPWSWGFQTRGSVVCVGEYGQHGQCGCVWYSRDYGQTFGKIFDLRDKAPDVPHAHIHGVCVDPYFDRVIIINGDGSPSTTPELAYHNPKLWWWDYNGETIDDNLADTIVWKSSDVGLDTSLGSNLQFVNGYALKDCIVLFSDGANNGIFRVNRGKKKDALKVDFALHLGIEDVFTKWCGGNMFRRDENSPLLICAIREYSCDLDPGDPGNPSNRPNTYKDVLSRVYSTYDGFHFEEVWVDDTYGAYDVFYTDDSSEQRNLAKCGRDMSVYQLPNGDVLMKYLGRDFQYVAYNNNGTTGNKTAYVRFNNEVAKFRFK
jgi:hypothetical protein